MFKLILSVACVSLVSLLAACQPAQPALPTPPAVSQQPAPDPAIAAALAKPCTTCVVGAVEAKDPPKFKLSNKASAAKR